MLKFIKIAIVVLSLGSFYKPETSLVYSLDTVKVRNSLRERSSFGSDKPTFTSWVNYSEAFEQARSENKFVVLFFTGSDWCHWCQKMEEEIINTPVFESFAKEKLVMVKVDFPRRSELSKEEIELNSQLKVRYKVKGFPTFIVAKSENNLVASLGYRPGGAEKFIHYLSGILN